MTQYVYMNERVKQKKPRKPVIVVQGPEGVAVSNLFEIRVGNMVIGYAVYDRKGLDECATHDVRAWLEFHDTVQLVPVDERKAKPSASAKKAGKPVQLGLPE